MRIRVIFYILLVSFKISFSQRICRVEVLDSIDNIKVRYATISINKNTILTNSEGVFNFRAQDSTTKLIVKAIGYLTDTFFISNCDSNFLLYLRKNNNIIKGVEIKSESNNERFKTFVDAINLLKEKSTFFSDKSKSFYRSYTITDSSSPAEYYEGYYNIITSLNGVRSPNLKAGRFLLPKEINYMNITPMVLFENFNPFNSDVNNIFPYTPFIFKEWSELKKYYKISIESKTPDLNGDTLIHFKFISRDNKNGFSGDFYYKINSKIIDKVILYADSIMKVPFSSIQDSSKIKILNLGYNIEIGFNNSNYIDFKYIDMDYHFDAQNQEKIKHIKTSMKLLLYDYGKHFQLPICRSIVGLSDYQKIAFYPYNSFFFERNQVLEEDFKENQIKKMFEKIECYDSKIKNYHSIPFLKHNVIEWTKDWELNLKFIPNKYINEAHYRIKYYKSELKKKEWDSTFASTILYLDYDCYPDTIVFNSNALLDYNYSYMLAKNDVDIMYFKSYFNLTKIVSNWLLKYLRKEFNSKQCPKDKKILKIFDKQNMGLEQDIYNIYANSNSRYKLVFKNFIENAIKKNLLLSEK